MVPTAAGGRGRQNRGPEGTTIGPKLFKITRDGAGNYSRHEPARNFGRGGEPGRMGGTMMDRRGDVTILDGAALVIGAAVAAAHVRGTFPGGLTGVGWGFVWAVFGGVALTAAGPFVYGARRYGRRPEGYPRVGDRLWAVLGLPWVLTSPLRSAGSGRPADFPAIALVLGLAASCLVSLVVVWKAWVIADPALDDRPHGTGPAPWTDRVGLALAVASPLQWGFGLAVLS